MKIKKRAFLAYFGLTTIFLVLVLFLNSTSYINDILLGGVCIGVLASLLVLTSSTGIEYLIVKHDTIQAYINTCAVFINRIEQALTYMNRPSEPKDCLYDWKEIKLYYSSYVSPAFRGISVLWHGREYSEYLALFQEITKYSSGNVSVIIDRLSNYFKGNYIDQNIEPLQVFHDLQHQRENALQDLGIIIALLQSIQMSH